MCKDLAVSYTFTTTLDLLTGMSKDRTNNRECTSLASQLASGGMMVGRDTLITYFTASQQHQLLV